MTGERPRGFPPTISHDAVEPVESADAAGLRAACLAHGGELYGYARRRLAEPGLAEEAVQETFLRAWRSRQRFDSSLGTMRGWLFAIERRVIIDLARDRTRRHTHPIPDDIAELDDHAEKVVAASMVRDAIAQLCPEQRHVLVEVYYRGRKCTDVARSLAIPEGTVRSRLFYALKALGTMIDEVGWAQGAARPQHTGPVCR